MNRLIMRVLVVIAVLFVAAGCSPRDQENDAGADAGKIDGGMDAGVDAGLPMALPFEFTRPQVGEPLTAEEITAFTKKLTGFWKQTQYFNWRLRTSHGYGPNVNICPPDGKSLCGDWSLRQDGANAVKVGDRVTFKHNGEDGGHNNWIGSSRVLAQAIAAYLYTGDKAAGKVAVQYMKALVATMKGFEYGPNDP
ncbi:MAG: hypothetical protein WC889_14670, partial [Myxococcota bacterium]